MPLHEPEAAQPIPGVLLGYRLAGNNQPVPETRCMPASVNAITADNATAVPESTPRLSVSLVGRLGVRFNGRPIELRTRKAGAVLSYLALSEAKQESRERLVGLLWSRSDEEKARASLRQVVRELRSLLEEAGYEGFVAERLVIRGDGGRKGSDNERG